MNASTETRSGGVAVENRRAGEVLDRVDDALRGLRFGTVTLIVQDGVVVQVDRTERLRLAHR
jgi:hypothetical protein